MPVYPRSKVVRRGEIATYHVWSRVVQRAFLCGVDPLTGIDFGYRRDWMEKLLDYQAGVFGVDLGSYSILTNHLHLIVRTRPDIVAGWSDEDVATRWKLAWPSWKNDQWCREPTDQQIREVLDNPTRLAFARKGLSDVSWFIARCKEPIARMGNAEVDHLGHFWEQRFGCRELEDEAAVLTCMVYVDVNQVKANVAPSLEESSYSAMQLRLKAQEQDVAAALEAFGSQERGDSAQAFTEQDAAALLADCFLAPITADGPLLTSSSIVEDQSGADDDSSPELAGDTPADNATDQVDETAASHDAESSAAGDDSAAAESNSTKTKGKGKSKSKSKAKGNPAKKKKPKESKTRKLLNDLKKRRRRRASDNAILPIPGVQYHEIVALVVEQLLIERGEGYRGEPPVGVPSDQTYVPLRQDLDPKRWLDSAKHFAAWFVQLMGGTAQVQECLDPVDHSSPRGSPEPFG